MIRLILNEDTIETDLAPGLTVLDFVRYRQNLKGTKIGCREGDCGACTVLVGELVGDRVDYRSMTSCLMPLSNANGKHIVTVEGINPKGGELTPVQRSLVDESGTQCGYCTVGFVMSMTGFCIDETPKNKEMAVSSVDGNICRCTGYKSIERACESVAKSQSAATGENRLRNAIKTNIVPGYFDGIKEKLRKLKQRDGRPPSAEKGERIVGGGTDLYVQDYDGMVEATAVPVFDNPGLRGISESEGFIEIGASATVTDLLISPVISDVFPQLYEHLKLVSSTPIRNMATLAGNFVNASPIGDMTVWFLALDAEVGIKDEHGADRNVPLRSLFLGYKDLAMSSAETITTIRFRKPTSDSFRFNFEKVCKRKYLDIATVNTAISMEVENGRLANVHAAAGGVAPIPLYLSETSGFLEGKQITGEIVSEACELLSHEISPISDVRGSADYKRLLLSQLFKAHFFELFSIEPNFA